MKCGRSQIGYETKHGKISSNADELDVLDLIENSGGSTDEPKIADLFFFLFNSDGVVLTSLRKFRFSISVFIV